MGIEPGKINAKRKTLLVIALVTVIAIPLVLLTGGGFRIAFSLIVLLFCPGYVLLDALFPVCKEIKPIERIALSIGLSIAAVSMFGLILHYTPLGLGVNSVFLTTVVFIFILLAVSWYRSGKIRSEDDEIKPAGFSFKLSQFKKLAGIDKTLTVAVMAAAVVCIGIFCYVAFTPVKGEIYTEFYLLDANGTTTSYPGTVASGDNVAFTAGVISHEENPAEYHIEVFFNNIKVNSVNTGMLAKDGKWEDVISFKAEQVGENQRVEVWLYKNDESQSYNKEPLYFFLNVTGAGQ